MKCSATQYRKAFSLLEMLLALALLSILAASLYASLAIAHRARNTADDVLRNTARLELSLELLRSDFESAMPPKGILAGSFIADDETTSGGEDADVVMFHTTGPTGDNDENVGCDIRRIELQLLEDDEQSDQLNLVRRITTNLLATTDPEVTDQVLCRKVQSLNLRYYDGLEWLDSWDSSTLDGELPLAVEMTLQLSVDESGQQVNRQSTCVFLVPSTSTETQSRGSMEGFR